MIFDKLEQVHVNGVLVDSSGHSMIFDKLELVYVAISDMYSSGHSMIFDKLERKLVRYMIHRKK